MEETKTVKDSVLDISVLEGVDLTLGYRISTIFQECGFQDIYKNFAKYLLDLSMEERNKQFLDLYNILVKDVLEYYERRLKEDYSQDLNDNQIKFIINQVKSSTEYYLSIFKTSMCNTENIDYEQLVKQMSV